MKAIYLLALTIGAAGILATSPPLRAATESDKAINDKIFYLLLNNRSLGQGTEKMTLTTHDGQVTVVGDAATVTEKDELRQAIAGVPGVQRVNDKQLIARPAPHSVGPNRGPLGPNP